MKTKKRLIDAYKLEKVVNEHPGTYSHRDDIIAAIAKMPTVDAVEVVRCKDCCHYRKATDWDGESYYACHKRAAVLIMQMNKDDFCSYGERKK